MTEKILIVDDDLDTIRLVGMMLDRQGYQIVAATSGAQALSLAKKEEPNLILLDVMMPDMDGVEVVRRLRSDPETQDLLIVMFTAKSETDDKLDGFDAGADEYITKPTQPRELVAHVKAILNRARRASIAAAPRSKTERGKVIGVLSAKGGVGVSTLALNLAVLLHSRFKNEVILADFRPGCGTIGLELGYSNSQGLNNLLALDAAKIRPQEVHRELISLPNGMRFLFASPFPRDARLSSAVGHYPIITKQLAHLSSVVVLDLGASITPLNDMVLGLCDYIIVVLEPVSPTIHQTSSLLEYLQEKGVPEDRRLLVLVNRVRAGIQLSLSEVQDQLGHNISVIITTAPELAYKSTVDHTPLALLKPDGVTAGQFHLLAKKVISILE